MSTGVMLQNLHNLCEQLIVYILSRVHNINIKRECRLLDRPRTNTLRKVEPINQRILFTCYRVDKGG